MGLKGSGLGRDFLSACWGRLVAGIGNRLFLTFHLLRSRIFPRRKLRILFSDKQDWKDAISKGFLRSPHTASFGEISARTVQQYDLVVPLTIEDLKLLNQVRSLLDGNPIPIPSLESVALCDDKVLLNQALIENGFGKFVPKMGGALGHPFILKKSIDAWGANSHLIADPHQERAFTGSLAHPDYFSQQFIAGPIEYATHIVVKDRKIVSSLNIKYVFDSDTPIKGKDQPIYKQLCGCPYLALFASILGAIGFEGLCCFNYKVQDNQPFILEINPRFGGSLCPYFLSFVQDATAQAGEAAASGHQAAAIG